MIKNCLDMYQKKNRKRVRGIYGTYETRKWNDAVDIYYYEKKRGGKLVLSKCLEESRERGVVFNSSLVSSHQNNLWTEAGWKVRHHLYLYSLFFNKEIQIQDSKKVVGCIKLAEKHFEKIVSIDKEIFDPFWRSSSLTLLDTLESCNETMLYEYQDRGKLLAYALVGVTMRSSFLQRFAVHPETQRLGIGSLLLENILSDMVKRKMISMKLNTQKENFAAQKLYEKNGFSLSKESLSIMSSD